jgi:ClpP class serine protease
MTLRDWSKYYEKIGMTEHNVYADASTEKNIEFRQALEKNYEPLRKNIINPFNDVFLASVKKNRYGKKLNEEQTLKGQLLITEKALKYGLIDSMGSFSDAVNLVNNLSNKQS